MDNWKKTLKVVASIFSDLFDNSQKLFEADHPVLIVVVPPDDEHGLLLREAVPDSLQHPPELIAGDEPIIVGIKCPKHFGHRVPQTLGKGPGLHHCNKLAKVDSPVVVIIHGRDHPLDPLFGDGDPLPVPLQDQPQLPLVNVPVLVHVASFENLFKHENHSRER